MAHAPSGGVLIVLSRALPTRLCGRAQFVVTTAKAACRRLTGGEARPTCGGHDESEETLGDDHDDAPADPG